MGFVVLTMLEGLGILVSVKSNYAISRTVKNYGHLSMTFQNMHSTLRESEAIGLEAQS